MSTNLPKLLLVVGPTASGKSELAIQVAVALNGEVISADSRSFYQELNIGVAKPSRTDRERVPHHLVDVTSIDQPWSLGEFQKASTDVIASIHARDKLPVLVGGTGQYFRAITQGWQVPENVGNEDMRIVIHSWGEAIGFDALYSKLQLLDPEATKSMDYRNHRRTIRAFEVLFLSGRRFSELKRSGEAPFDLLTIGLDWPRDQLYARVDERIQAMFEAGFVGEVHDLLAAGKEDQLRRIGIIGYSEVLDYLDGKFSLEDCVQLIKRNTRRFIRHQANWFKPTDPAIHWFKANDPELYQKVLGHVQNWLLS
ncbi:MAG TPA: tRNA (adenosine(37)-N6)-dimethylallyltransferase MiaA [Anaerolineaceae bacterium]|nr:tRNA (adenosine(37)-N6)-dimethylallyltransferase MiaA [Anaerolineaceae bacterium]